MQEPRCIAQLLHCESHRPIDFTITHGKGRKGIIIRTEKPNCLSVIINSVKLWLENKYR